MTTTVVVRANHGWDVLVDHIEKNSTISRNLVPKNTEQSFSVWQGRSILVTEIAPGVVVDTSEKMFVFTQAEQEKRENDHENAVSEAYYNGANDVHDK